MNMLIKRFELLSSWQRALLLAGSGLFALAVTREVAGARDLTRHGEGEQPGSGEEKCPLPRAQQLEPLDEHVHDVAPAGESVA